MLIAGYPLNCTLTLKTGNDMSIPENATLRIITDHTVQCSTPGTMYKYMYTGTCALQVFTERLILTATLADFVLQQQP